MKKKTAEWKIKVYETTELHEINNNVNDKEKEVKF